MKAFVAINLLLLGVVAVILFLLLDDWRDSALLLAIAGGIAGSGALTAWLYFQRSKVYKERDESRPDD